MNGLSSPNSHYRPYLDQVRWIAASIVAVGHAIGILNSRSNGSGVLNYVADMRGPAVYIFFVLSGYLVGGLVLRDCERFRFSSYCIARTSRIYIVLIPAIFLTVSLDGLAFHMYSASPLYAKIWQGGALGDDVIFSRYTFANFLGSIFSLEPLFSRPIGSAASLWSLGYEWIFYFSFPLLYAMGHKLNGVHGANIIILVSIIATFFATRIGAAFWIIWLLGAYARKLKLSDFIRNERIEAIVKAVAFLSLLTLLINGSRISHQICIVGIGIFGFVFLSSNPLWEHRFATRYDHVLAGFSYSLYVTHLQFLTFLAATLYAMGMLPVNGIVSPFSVVIYTIGLLIAAFALAIVFGRLFESRTQTLSQWLEARLVS